MKLNLIFCFYLFVLLPFLCYAQGKVKMKNTPAWAASHHYTGQQDVYFPDYYTFYDPENGYYYWNDGKWTSSPTVPAFMSSVDLNKARMEVIKEDIKPDIQKEYLLYKKKYPAKKVEVTVPVPVE